MAALLALAGCVYPESIEKAKLKTDKTSVVVVGVENGYAGKCYGALSDAAGMKTRLSKYSTKVTVFKDKTATAAAVKAALEEAVKNDLAIFYFSGHGGTYKFNDTGAEEVDGKDEYICCYDYSIRDNDIWKIICKSKGRVMLMFDCCHSETMFRTSGFTFKKAQTLCAGSQRAAVPNMLCWSGCPDSGSSYGTSAGGKFTIALKSATSSTSTTYDKAWKKISENKTVKKY